jgi:hypothetical protein
MFAGILKKMIATVRIDGYITAQYLSVIGN